MRKRLLPLELVLILLLSGCTTPPLNVVPGGVINNDATLDYAFGRGDPFRLVSLPVAVSTLVPRASGYNIDAEAQYFATDVTAHNVNRDAESLYATTDAEALLNSARAASSVGQSDVASFVEHDTQRSGADSVLAQSEVHDSDATASGDDSDAASSVEQASANGYNDIFVASALREATSGKSTINERFEVASGEIISRRSFIDSKDSAGAEYTKGYQSSCGYKFACSQIDSLSVMSQSSWVETKPEIKIWASQDFVVIGSRFFYFIEVKNVSPVELEFAEVQDILDSRVCVDIAAVQTIPQAEVQVNLVECRMSIRFIHGIRRGKTIKIKVPVTLKTDLIEQDKDMVGGIGDVVLH